MEITKDKVTELFCIIDEFYKVFDAENAGKLLLSEDGVKRRRRKASLSDSEIMTILLYFHFGSFRNFKHEPTLKSKACLKCLYFMIIIFDLCCYLEYFSYLYTINQTE